VYIFPLESELQDGDSRNELRTEVTTRAEADDLRTYTMNCSGQTLFIFVRGLVNDLLLDHASRFPKRGLGTGDAFDELYRQFDRLGGTHLVVFDEIDHFVEANTLLLTTTGGDMATNAWITGRTSG